MLCDIFQNLVYEELSDTIWVKPIEPQPTEIVHEGDSAMLTKEEIDAFKEYVEYIIGHVYGYPKGTISYNNDIDNFLKEDVNEN